MALIVELKPHERLIIDGAVIKNGPTRTTFHVENMVPILREKDILGPREADSPSKRIYLAIQLMYIDEQHLPDHHKLYWELVKDLAEAAPSRDKLLVEISGHVTEKRYYQALKATRKLIDYEQEVIARVRNASEGI
jgi:flagellar biosynthesis repressor protein FlbT